MVAWGTYGPGDKDFHEGEMFVRATHAGMHMQGTEIAGAEISGASGAPFTKSFKLSSLRKILRIETNEFFDLLANYPRLINSFTFVFSFLPNSNFRTFSVKRNLNSRSKRLLFIYLQG